MRISKEKISFESYSENKRLKIKPSYCFSFLSAVIIPFLYNNPRQWFFSLCSFFFNRYHFLSKAPTRFRVTYYSFHQFLFLLFLSSFLRDRISIIFVYWKALTQEIAEHTDYGIFLNVNEYVLSYTWNVS